MIKKLLFVILGLVLVVGVLAGIKALQITSMIEAGKAFKVPPATVTSRKVEIEVWDNLIHAVGSFEAVQGVSVSVTLSGQVDAVLLESGSDVEKGEVLIQQDISSEQAQLREAEANAKVAQLNLHRQKILLQKNSISQSFYDTAKAELDGAISRADSIKTTIEKKTIRAPFSGRLGINQVNVGQNLQVGEEIVTLQSMDPIYLNFSLPQDEIAHVKKGLSVRVGLDGLVVNLTNASESNSSFIYGVINAINPQADSSTRNVLVQALVENPERNILPGMFADISIIKEKRSRVLPVPVTAVQYAPYGDSVFVIEERDGSFFLRQQIIRLGTVKGDFVEVVSGLKDGETVVTVGGFKLHNGQEVVVDNALSPNFSLHPEPKEG